MKTMLLDAIMILSIATAIVLWFIGTATVVTILIQFLAHFSSL